MSGTKSVFDSNHMVTRNEYFDLNDSDSDPSPRLLRALESFEPSQITKQDALEEDLRSLGYLNE